MAAYRRGRINGAFVYAFGNGRTRYSSGWNCRIRDWHRTWRLIDVCLCVGDVSAAIPSTRNYVEIVN